MASHRLVCPYCYESFRDRDALFRCTGRTSRAGRACARKVDDVLAQRLGRREALPPVFAADGRRDRAACPECQDETSHHVCPCCHGRLPLHFGKVPGRMIALVGARDSGKSVFVTVLLHELMHRVGARFNAAVVPCDDDTRSRFAEDYEHALYQRGQVGSTRPAGRLPGGLVTPLVFRFSAERAGRLGGSRISRCLLSFFDTAGEDLSSQASVDINARYLASADGIILLLDPLQMPAPRALAAPGSRLPAPATASASPVNVLTRVTELLQGRQGGGPSARIARPMAVAFSKLDVLWQHFDQGSPLRRPAPGGGEFDVRDSLDVHEHVRALLEDWDGAQLDQVLRHHYARYRYFGFSALGESPGPDNLVSRRGVQPYRVADPFLWLLAEFGAIASTRS